MIGYLPPGGPHVRMDSHLYPDYLVLARLSRPMAGPLLLDPGAAAGEGHVQAADPAQA